MKILVLAVAAAAALSVEAVVYRFGACVELNGEKIAPPKWKRPGLMKGDPIADWTPAWTLYEADEEPFTDQEYVMREPTPIRLRKGWNHVKLTIPNPAAAEKTKHRWVGTFIPVAGTTDHPHEVPGLEYSSCRPEFGTGAWTPVGREFDHNLVRGGGVVLRINQRMGNRITSLQPLH